MPEARNPHHQPISGPSPSQGSEPPSARDVGAEFQLVEESIRRYVDYRFADLAPLDGSFYRRRRVEIWSSLILLAILLHAFLVWRTSQPAKAQKPPGSAVSTPAAGSGAATPPPTTANLPQPAVPDDTSDDVNTDEVDNTALESAPFTVDALAIYQNPNDQWEAYVEARQDVLLRAIDDIVAGVGWPRSGAVTEGQVTNFKKWKPEFESSNGSAPESVRLAARQRFFEYAVMDWRAKSGNNVVGLRVDGLPSAKEYPPALLRLLVSDFNAASTFSKNSDLDPSSSRLQSLIVMAWLERTYGQNR